MLAGLPYLANQDGLLESRMAAQELLYTYNNLPPQRWEEQRGLLEQLLGGIGENSTILPPLRCDYGKHIVVGRDVFTNYNLTILDVCQVTIGDRTLIGPNVSIYAAGHPIARRTGPRAGSSAQRSTSARTCGLGAAVSSWPGSPLEMGPWWELAVWSPGTCPPIPSPLATPPECCGRSPRPTETTGKKRWRDKKYPESTNSRDIFYYILS